MYTCAPAEALMANAYKKKKKKEALMAIGNPGTVGRLDLCHWHSGPNSTHNAT